MTRSRSSLVALLTLVCILTMAPPRSGAGPLDVLRGHTPKLASVSAGLAGVPTGIASGVRGLAARKPAVAGLRMRVATYNIAHARGNKRGGINELGSLGNLEGIARLLREEQVDIVGCTEISGVDFRSGLCDQPRYLAARLGFQSAYGENFRIALVGAAQGNAVLSRFPIKATTNHKLFRLSEKEEQRGCLEALIDLGNDRQVRVFVAHLSLKAEESSRQIAQILELVKQRREPCLLMGDLNSGPASANIAAINAEMTDLTANVDTTYMNEPGAKLDYIFLRGGFRPEGKAWVRGFKEGYSDHGCLIASVRLDSEN